MAPGADSQSSRSRRPTRRWRGISYRLALALWMAALVLITGATLIAVAVRTSTASATALARELFAHNGREAVEVTRQHLAAAGPLVDSLHHLVGEGLALEDDRQLARQFTAFLRAYPAITWISYGDANGRFSGAHYVSPGRIRINRSWIVDNRTIRDEHNVRPDGVWELHARSFNTGYDPRNRPFYRKAAEKGRLVWLPPYMFYDSARAGISCARPVYDADGALRGVLTVDFELHALSQFIAEERFGQSGQLLLMTADGGLLASPNTRRAATPGDVANPPTVASAGSRLERAFLAALQPQYLGHADQGMPARMFAFQHDGRPYFASATAFNIDEDMEWVVAAIAPQEDFLGGAWRTGNLLLRMALVALLLALLLALALGRRITRPVGAMRAFMARVGKGDLDQRADFGGSREFRELSDALNQMIADLRDRLRLLNSLELAQQVQRKLLPQAPPRVKGLDIFGHSIYCEETGGDYYDYLVLDKPDRGRVLIAMGDVMGHGIAAALVMATARAILRSYSATSRSLAATMAHLNRLLVEDLDGERFMTLHLSVVDRISGAFRWTSAGHDPAIIYDPVADRFHQSRYGEIPLGILDDVAYGEYGIEALTEGAIIVLGTDGIWETRNRDRDMFGKERVHEAIRAASAGSAADIGREILDRLQRFRGDTQQIDDITFVVIKLVPMPSDNATDSGADDAVEARV